MNAKKKVTIVEIAKMAGFDVSTVSRALNHPDMVKKETRDSIMEVVRRFDYQPNVFARGLQTQKSDLVALVVPNFTNLSFTNLARGVQETLRKHGYTMLIFSSHESIEWERKICSQISKLQLDGVIFASGSTSVPPIEEIGAGTERLFIDRDGRALGIDTLLPDFGMGFEGIIEALKARGHKRIGLLSGDAESYTGKEITMAYQQAMGKNELFVPSEYICSSMWAAKDGWNAARELMLLENPPTAIIAATDTIALGALGSVQRMGLQVPQDISIVGFNNEPGSESLNPPLTTLMYDAYKLGTEAAETLVGRIDDGDSDPVFKRYGFHILERESVGNAPQKA
jgi:DNA-binding LacI/PurR family transcriptional regulator